MSHDHDVFWAGFFGIRANDFGRVGVSVVPHVGLVGYEGIWFFLREARLVISAPESWVPRLQAEFADAPPELPSRDRLARVLGASLGRCIGPAFQGAAEGSTFREARATNTRPLLDSDAAAITAFSEACGSDDWDDSGLDEAALYRCAHFESGRILAMAGFRRWSSSAGDPCVITHPNHRGAGLAAGVVSAVLASALAQGHLLLYQTLEANVAAVRLAFSLGYARYANHLAVRLRASSSA